MQIKSYFLQLLSNIVLFNLKLKIQETSPVYCQIFFITIQTVTKLKAHKTAVKHS